MSDRTEPAATDRARADLDELRRRVASLTPEQRAVVEERLLARRAAAPDSTRIPRRPAGEPCPLSLPQQRLWFLDQLHPGSVAYHSPAALHLAGELDVASLGRALDEIVVRHEALRTVIATRDGEPYQVVGAPGPLALDALDLSDVPAAARAAALAAALGETVARPFDLAVDYPIRARLLRLGPAEHVLLLVTHHIASDGWSMGVLHRELGTLYDAFTAGRPSPLAPLAIQYGDFAMWQRGQVEGPELARQIAYWRRQLAGLPPEVTLPGDRPRPTVRTFHGARRIRVFPKALVDALKDLGRREGATLYMALLAGFLALLHRYTGQTDVVVASPIAGRTRVETEPLIGFFVGTLVLRGDLDGDPTVREHLRRTREVALQAYAHQDVPFEKLVEVLAPERTLNRNPIAQVMFGLQNARGELPALRGLQVARRPMGSEAAKFDVTVYATEVAGGLEVSAGYGTELYDAGTVDRLLEHFERLLAAMVAAPEAPLGTLDLLGPAERGRVIDDGNCATADIAPVDIAALVATQAARTPRATAVAAGGARLTFAALDAAANRLARYLRARGAGPGAFVGVCARRSPEMVVSLLAVLKAGAAYLPLDPGYPADRLRVMLDDARPRLVLVHESLRALLPLDGIETVALDDPGAWAVESTSDPKFPVDPDAVAYATYTSGSTGRPKGILTTHRGVVNYLTYLQREYALGGADVVLPIVTIGFDASVREIFGALSTGARLVLLGDDEVRDPRAVVQALREHGVTVQLAVVPSMLRALAAAAQETGSPPPALRLILTSGEPLLLADVHLARADLCPHGDVVNQYGPTECTMTTTFHRVGAADEGRGMVSIGRPIPNARVYVLDPAGQPTPVGVPGELHVGGAGVTRGYLERPELTAACFVPDPFARVPGARMYRTGDRGRWCADGTLELFGRLDEQLKIRGNRVEPGEVETRLRECAGVEQVAVVAWPAGTPAAPDARLIAYVVAAPGAAPLAAELRAQLRRSLPEYMVPSAFVPLAALPIGPHGKLDRRALPPPSDEAVAPPGLMEPRHPLESQIAAIWKGVLGISRVGVFDDFFDLGGHSLLAARLMQKLAQELGSTLPLTTLFSSPTIAGLAAAVQQAHQVDRHDLVAPLRVDGSKPPLFFFHGDYNGGGFYSRALARALAPDQPCYAVHPHPLTDRPIPPTVDAMITELVAAIRAIRPRGPYRLGGHCNGAIFAFEAARRLVAEGDVVEAVLLVDASARNVRFRALRRAVAALARLRGLDRNAEAALFLRMRDGMTERIWATARMVRRLRAGGSGAPPSVVGTGGDDLDLESRESFWTETPRVAAFRRVVRSHVPGRYGGTVTLLIPEERPRPCRDLWWARVAADVEVHSVPGAHLTAITEHGAAVAARIQECLDRVDARGPRR